MAYSSAEVKSGVLVTVSIVLLLALTFVVGGFMRGETQPWQVQFGYVGGVEENAPVYFAGREVGKIDDIEVLPGEERPILITMSILSSIPLRTDTEVFVDMLGMMGEKILEVTPGTANAQLLKRGEILEGTDPIPMYLLIQKMNLLADRMDDLTTSLNPMIERVDGLLENNEAAIQSMVKNISASAESLAPVLKQTNKMLKKHEEEIARMMANFEETSANVRDMTRDLKFRPWRLVRKGKVKDDDD